MLSDDQIRKVIDLFPGCTHVRECLDPDTLRMCSLIDPEHTEQDLVTNLLDYEDSNVDRFIDIGIGTTDTPEEEKRAHKAELLELWKATLASLSAAGYTVEDRFQKTICPTCGNIRKVRSLKGTDCWLCADRKRDARG